MNTIKKEKIAKVVDCTKSLRFSYFRESKEFQDTLSSFKESIYSRAIEDDIICHVANYILEFGSDRLIEGVGYIAINGTTQGEPFSGINWETDGEQFDFEISEDIPYK